MPESTGPLEADDTQDMPAVQSGRVHVDVAGLSDQGKVRDRNEDTYAVFRLARYLEALTTNLPDSDLPPRAEDSGYVMLLADGVGGHEAGEVASRTIILSTLQGILRSPRWTLRLDDPATREEELEDIRQQADRFLTAVHQDVRLRARSDSSLRKMGTTYTGAYSTGLDLFLMHVGDSRAYLLRGGDLVRITRDHTAAQQYADLGLIAQEEVPTHKLRNVLIRAVTGHGECPEGDFHHVILESGDRLLLCTDGLTDMAGEAEIAAALERETSSGPACRALVGLALERGGRDNVTVIVAGYRAE